MTLWRALVCLFRRNDDCLSNHARDRERFRAYLRAETDDAIATERRYADTRAREVRPASSLLNARRDRGVER